MVIGGDGEEVDDHPDRISAAGGQQGHGDQGSRAADDHGTDLVPMETPLNGPGC